MFGVDEITEMDENLNEISQSYQSGKVLISMAYNTNPQNVIETIAFLLTLRITFWTIDEHSTIEIQISPYLSYSMNVLGRMYEHEFGYIEPHLQLLAKIDTQDLEGCVMEMLLNYVPFPADFLLGEMKFVIRKTPENIVEIYGAQSEAGIIEQISYRVKLVVQGLKSALYELFRKKGPQ